MNNDRAKFVKTFVKKFKHYLKNLPLEITLDSLLREDLSLKLTIHHRNRPSVTWDFILDESQSVKTNIYLISIFLKERFPTVVFEHQDFKVIKVFPKNRKVLIENENNTYLLQYPVEDEFNLFVESLERDKEVLSETLKKEYIV